MLFISTQKLFSFSRYLSFCQDLLIMEEKRLDWSQPDLETITIHILPNFLQSKENQGIKFGQLIEYNNRNIFLQKLRRKWGKESSSRSLSIF